MFQVPFRHGHNFFCLSVTRTKRRHLRERPQGRAFSARALLVLLISIHEESGNVNLEYINDISTLHINNVQP